MQGFSGSGPLACHANGPRRVTRQNRVVLLCLSARKVVLRVVNVHKNM